MTRCVWRLLLYEPRPDRERGPTQPLLNNPPDFFNWQIWPLQLPKKKHHKIWRPCRWVILKQIDFWTICICTPIISSLWCFQPHAPHLLHQYLPISSATDPGPNYNLSQIFNIRLLGHSEHLFQRCKKYVFHMTCSTSTLLVFSGIFWAFAWSPSVLMKGRTTLMTSCSTWNLKKQKLQLKIHQNHAPAPCRFFSTWILNWSQIKNDLQ